MELVLLDDRRSERKGAVLLEVADGWKGMARGVSCARSGQRRKGHRQLGSMEGQRREDVLELDAVEGAGCSGLRSGGRGCGWLDWMEEEMDGSVVAGLDRARS